jgi:hypothetical protein
MKVRSSNEVLERAESIRHNEEGDCVTFSFVSSSGVTLYRGELSKEGIGWFLEHVEDNEDED